MLNRGGKWEGKEGKEDKDSLLFDWRSPFCIYDVRNKEKVQRNFLENNQSTKVVQSRIEIVLRIVIQAKKT